MESLHERRALLHQPPTALDHLTGAHTGLLGQTPQGQTLETLLHHGLLLCLQPGHTQRERSQISVSESEKDKNPRRILGNSGLDSLLPEVAALSGLGGVALEEDLQLRRVTVGGDDEVSHLMETGVGAVAATDTHTTK